LLEGLGFEALAKTSGSLELHVHTHLAEPLDGKALAREIATRLAAERPDEVVSHMRRAARAGRVYVDWLQNDPSRQTVAPYSLRGLPYPTVATPVRWDEVERAIETGEPELLRFSPEDVRGRLESKGDLFEPLR
jgi:bifunctional non-homologous end joining protein LigD